MGRGFECENGWLHLIDTMCEAIQFHIDHDPTGPAQFIALQIKEEFGTLRVYYKGGDEYIRGLVSMTEYLSSRTCENCGVINEHVGHTTKGWIQTLCACCDKVSGINDRNWKVRDADLAKIWQKKYLDEKVRKL